MAWLFPFGRLLERRRQARKAQEAARTDVPEQ
jgi:hypothetical protein